MPRPKLWFYPYDRFSQSALQLAEALDGRLIKRERSAYIYRDGDIICNWGCSRIPRVFPTILNNPSRVAIATSKLSTFRVLAEHGIQVPEVTQDRGISIRWAETGKVVGRDLDRGSQGRGIHVYPRGNQPEQHAFYTRYIKKEREFRVHVFGGRIIFQQEKLRRRDAATVDRYIRSHSRGWCFGFQHLSDNPVPPTVLQQAIRSVNALALDFGAVDIGWSDRSDGTVFEINTAPGIENSSLSAYVEAFRAIN